MNSKPPLKEVISKLLCFSLRSVVETRSTATFLSSLCNGQVLQLLKHQCKVKNEDIVIIRTII